MQKSRFNALQFLVGAVGAVVLFSGIITFAAIWVALPWGAADEAVLEALPPAQGETRSDG